MFGIVFPHLLFLTEDNLHLFIYLLINLKLKLQAILEGERC